MNDRDLIGLISNTNPYPDEASLSEIESMRGRVLATLAAGSASFPDVRPQQQSRESLRNRWLAAAAAFIAVVLAIGLVRVFSNREPDVVVPLPPFETPQLAAEALATALEVQDFESYLQLWAPDGWDRGFGGAPLTPEKHEERFIAGAGITELLAGPTCVPISELTWECTSTRRDWELGIISDDNVVVTKRTVMIDSEGRIASASRVDRQLTPSQRRELDAMDRWLDANFPEIQEDYRQIFRFLEPFDGSPAEFRAAYEAALAEYAATLDEEE